MKLITHLSVADDEIDFTFSLEGDMEFTFEDIWRENKIQVFSERKILHEKISIP